MNNFGHATFCLTVNKSWEIFFSTVMPLVHRLIIFWEMPVSLPIKKKLAGWIKVSLSQNLLGVWNILGFTVSPCAGPALLSEIPIILQPVTIKKHPTRCVNCVPYKPMNHCSCSQWCCRLNRLLKQKQSCYGRWWLISRYKVILSLSYSTGLHNEMDVTEHIWTQTCSRMTSS